MLQIKKLIAVMTSFSIFLSSLDADAGRRGKQFESFVKWFLKNDPEWSTQVDTVWMWDEYPQRWGPDCGIDLVFKHKNGETWAVQSKCYASEYDITKHDVDKFLSESNRKGIDKRLLIATTDRIGVNARQVCQAQEKPVIRFLLSHFEDADIEYPASFADLNKAKPKPKPTPKEHQVEAINTVTAKFHSADRGQLIMACGTGKTFTTLWIKERLNSESTLVLLPSLGLLSQTLHEWTSACNQAFNVLCVCSDESVGKRGSDEAVHSVADLAFPVTSKIEEITGFLKQKGPKVIFSTYQSSALVADAQADQSVSSFNLAIADEAHRCAGKIEGSFSTILNGKRIRADKRLFTTATPRTYSTALKKSAEGRGVEIVGMDEEAFFGKQLYTLSFGEAIRRGLLTDYRVVIVGVDNPTIGSYIENRELVKTESGVETDAEGLAAQIALLKTIKDFDLHRMISFHSRVSRAESFAKDLKIVSEWVDVKDRPDGHLTTDFVSGDMTTFARRQKLSILKNAKDTERNLLTNARCLSEGVDVPSLDGVAFIDPRASQVDIIQAVGRAIRLSPNKKVGTIILPVFVEHGDNAEQVLDESNFKPIWDVLNALRAHDDVLAEELDQIRVGMGKRGLRKTREQFNKIFIDLPASIDQSFVNAIASRLVESTTDTWDFWFGLICRFIEQNGNSNVPQKYVTEDGFFLGRWVQTQRLSSDLMPISRKERLQSLIGWQWSKPGVEWDEMLEELRRYVEKNGDSNVPQRFISDSGLRLGRWVHLQRNSQEKISASRTEKLETITDWQWTSPVGRRPIIEWEQMYEHLKDYLQKNSNANVPQRYIAEDGLKLGRWVNVQRGNQNKLSNNQKIALESLDGWRWAKPEKTWEEMLEVLKAYVEKNGNANIPQQYVTTEGVRLGRWFYRQRTIRDTLSVDRKKILEELSQ